MVKFYTRRVQIVQILELVQKKYLLKKANTGEYTCSLGRKGMKIKEAARSSYEKLIEALMLLRNRMLYR